MESMGAPWEAQSRTMVEEIMLYSGRQLIKTVSMLPIRRLASAICISNSRSEELRSPRTITSAPSLCARSTSKPVSATTRTLRNSRVISSSICIRTSGGNAYCLARWDSTATTSSSNIADARRMTSRCPRVGGEKLPA